MPPTITTHYQEVNSHLSLGNLNRFIRLSLEKYAEFQGLHKEIMERVCHLLSTHSQSVSPDTRVAIEKFCHGDFKKDACFHGLLNLLPLPCLPDVPPVGKNEIFFPVSSSLGSVYKLSTGLDSDRSQRKPSSLPLMYDTLVDRLGHLVIGFINSRALPVYLWIPGAFILSIKDGLGREVTRIQGESLSMALVLSLFSLVTGVALPGDISATGRVDSTGKILPVTGLTEKLTALKEEGFFIKRIFIAQDQTLPLSLELTPPEFQLIRVSDIDTLILSVFPEVDYSAICPASALNLKKSMARLESQYQRYHLTACLENARSILACLDSRPQGIDDVASSETHEMDCRFLCLWKIGCCLCHLGDVEESDSFLRQAQKVYRKNRGRIDLKRYLECCNNHAVLLKDIFCYARAERMHRDIDTEMKTASITHDQVGKNLSSLSQLKLAMHEFKEAEDLQKQAIKMVPACERWRNYGYLTQIYSRWGKTKKASAALQQAKTLLERMPEGNKNVACSYFHWIQAEYLYHKVCAMKQRRRQDREGFLALAKKYDGVNGYVGGLINKFCGLGLIKTHVNAAEKQMGFQCLEKARAFFEGHSSPVLKLLGVSVLIETIVAKHGQGIPWNHFSELKTVCDHLSLQKNIRNHFKKDLEALSCHCMETPSGKGLSSKVFRILEQINNEIPY